MKKIYFFLLMSFLAISSCTKQEMIPETELTGIWKLNGYTSSNYKMEITPDGYLYWWNYNDVYNKTEEFELEYDINGNCVKLYKPNKNTARHQFKVYRNRKGGLYFSIPVQGIDAEGNSITNTDTYYKMN